MSTTRTHYSKQSRGQGRRTDFPRLLSGNLCLDFINTVEGRSTSHPGEFLNDYADLVAWGEHVGILSDAQIAGLLEDAQQAPEAAAAQGAHAVALRETLYRIFVAVAREQS